jgi:hypothetical protein
VELIRDKDLEQCQVMHSYFGCIKDMSKATVTSEQLGNVLKRVQGSGVRNIKDIVVMPKK